MLSLGHTFLGIKFLDFWYRQNVLDFKAKSYGFLTVSPLLGLPPCSQTEALLFSSFNFQDKYVEISHSSGMDALCCRGPRFLTGGENHSRASPSGRLNPGSC